MAEEINLNTDFEQLPDKWADWKVEERIGTGSFGTVYLAVREEEKCAIKVIQIPSDEAERSALLAETHNEGTARQYLQDLIRNYTKEIEAMYTLKDEPNIVRIMDHEIEELAPFGYRIYIRMELLTSLRDYLAGRNVTESEVVQIGLDICDALTACDRQRIIHRDIKPDNIFRSDEGIYKLGDFGTARQMDLTFGTYSAKGTFSYMAPEVYKGERYNKQVDIYSLGIVLYRLMNRNRDPFLDPLKQLIFYQEREDALRSRMEGEPLPPPIDASEKFTRVICKACAYRADERYDNAAAFKADLEKVLDPYADISPDCRESDDKKTTVESDQENRAPGIRSSLLRHRVVLLAILVAIGTGTGIITYIQRNQQTVLESQGSLENKETDDEAAIPDVEVLGENEEGYVALRGAGQDISEGMKEALEASDELVTTLADYAFKDRESFDSLFMNASEEAIDNYYIDFRKYNDYPYHVKVPVAESGDVYMISYVRYMDNEQEQESDDIPWSKGFNLLMTKDKETWKINLDEGSKSEIREILLNGAFPKGYADNLQNERHNSIMEDRNNYIYLSPDAVYENVYARQVRFVWQNEEGDVLVSILFTNSADQAYTFSDLRLKLNDRELGTVLDTQLPGEVSVEAGKNKLYTYRIDVSEVITGIDLWKDVTGNIIEGSLQT